MVRYAYAERTPQIETKREVTGMKRALLCVLLAALLLCGCTHAPASTVRAPDAGEPLTLCALLLILPNAMGSVNGTWVSVPLSQIIAMLLSLLLIHKNRILEHQLPSHE